MDTTFEVTCALIFPNGDEAALRLQSGPWKISYEDMLDSLESVREDFEENRGITIDTGGGQENPSSNWSLYFDMPDGCDLANIQGPDGPFALLQAAVAALTMNGKVLV